MFNKMNAFKDDVKIKYLKMILVAQVSSSGKSWVEIEAKISLGDDNGFVQNILPNRKVYIIFQDMLIF